MKTAGKVGTPDDDPENSYKSQDRISQHGIETYSCRWCYCQWNIDSYQSCYDSSSNHMCNSFPTWTTVKGLRKVLRPRMLEIFSL